MNSEGFKHFIKDTFALQVENRTIQLRRNMYVLALLAWNRVSTISTRCVTVSH